STIEYARPSVIARVYGVSRTRQYLLWRAGKIRFLDGGGRTTLVDAASVRQYINTLPERQPRRRTDAA
ncbi:MAG: hypothetical protein ACREFP_09010, partial [Acetobacteraceae bacterium]